VAATRIPAGLTFSMGVAAVSLGVMTIFWNLDWPAEQGLPLLAHAGAGLCLLWAVAAGLVQRDWPGFAARVTGKDLLAVLRIGAMAAGLAAVLIMLYVGMIETIFRTLMSSYEATPRLHIWPTGFIDLAAVAGAILIAWRQTRNHDLITALFWLLIFTGLWAAFQMPAFRVESPRGFEPAVATRWAGLFMLNTAAVIAAFTTAGGMAHRRRRRRACPDTPWVLAESPTDWPGFRYSAGLTAVVVLILGCINLTVPWTGVAAFLAGCSMLALAARRWNENLADAGLALVTLGVVSLMMISFSLPAYWTPAAIAEVFNRVLVGLAVMTGLWYWLAGFWRQQLDDGRPWTTAGRLIRTSQRVGYLVGATAVLISFHLALWPRFAYVGDLDNSTRRWVWGLSANGLLILAFVLAARRTGRATPAWLALFTAASAVMFALVRSPHSAVGRTWQLHWPVAVALGAAPMLLLAALAARSSKWRPFWEPAYLTGILIAPLTAIAGLSLTERLRIAQWVPAATFGALTGLYLLAAVVPGPRTFLAVAVVCAAMGIRNLRLLGGSSTIGAAYFYPMLCGLSVALWACLHRHPRRAGTARVVIWAGGAPAVISLIAGLIASGP